MGGFFDAPAKQKELEKYEEQISAPGFWDDQESAQKIVQQRSRIDKALERQKAFETGVSDAEVLFEFAEDGLRPGHILHNVNHMTDAPRERLVQDAWAYWRAATRAIQSVIMST